MLQPRCRPPAAASSRPLAQQQRRPLLVPPPRPPCCGAVPGPERGQRQQKHRQSGVVGAPRRCGRTQAARPGVGGSAEASGARANGTPTAAPAPKAPTAAAPAAAAAPVAGAGPTGAAPAPSAAAAATRRTVLGSTAAAAAAAATTSSIVAGPARAVQTVTLRDGTQIEAYEHGMTLSIVALRGSVPTQWVVDFRQALGRYAGFELGQRGQLQEIFDELKDPKAKRSAGAADVVTLGDAWLAPAIRQGLIQPIASAETYRWWRRLPRRWQQLVRRGPDGAPSDSGEIWGCPYRWGATLVAYKRDLLLRRGGRPIRDWSDLLQPQLKGAIAFPESSREFVGVALKTLNPSNGGAARPLGFNSGPADLAAAGVPRTAARAAVRALLRQARAFSDRDHVRTLMAGDTWAVVGTSEDLVPLAERTPSLELVAPASGVPLWADIWAVPAGASGGHLKKGPSPVLPSWLEFGVLPARAGSLGSLRTGGTPLLLPSPPAPPKVHHAHHPAPPPAERRGLLAWLRRRGRSQEHAHHNQHHAAAATSAAEQQQLAAFLDYQKALTAPPDPADALLGGPKGFMPSDAALRRSEFLLPLDDDRLELYKWLLGRAGPGDGVVGA